MKITPTSLLTTGVRMLITYLLGAFMFINLGVVGSYSYEAYENYQQYKAIGSPAKFRIHKFSGTQFTTDPQGTYSRCVVATTDSKYVAYLNHSDTFCAKVYSELGKWDAANHSSPSVIEGAFWGIMFFAVFVVGFFLLVSIPTNLVGGMFTGLARYSNLVAILLTLAVVVPFWTMFFSAGMSKPAGYWMTSDGYAVKTMQVFSDDKGQWYKAPDNLFGWTSSQTMEKVSK